jgi:hypothetical protein
MSSSHPRQQAGGNWVFCLCMLSYVSNWMFEHELTGCINCREPPPLNHKTPIGVAWYATPNSRISDSKSENFFQLL